MMGCALECLSACGGSTGPAATYSVGGQISGLVGPGLVLINGKDKLNIPASATSFVFPTTVASGTAYSVEVQADPYEPTQLCSISGGSGTMQNANVSSVKITCADVHGQWVWRGGSQTPNMPSQFGTKGQASPSAMPGAREAALGWTDSNGRLWMYGGARLSDLWMFDAGTLQWTWVGGSQAMDAAPSYGSRGMAAPSNDPGARGAAATWVDSSGNLWLFGGTPLFDRAFGDLWKYDIANGQWTWVSGSDQPNSNPVYGTPGVPGNTTTPGAGYGFGFWQDGMGNFWLLDGVSIVWTYSESTGLWTAVTANSPATITSRPYPRLGPAAGYDAIDMQALIFGGVAEIPLVRSAPPDAETVWSFNGSVWTGEVAPQVSGSSPGSTLFPENWTDRSGALWVYGGWYYGAQAGASPTDGVFSKFTSTSGGGGTWTAVPGGGDTAVYGTLNIPNGTNTPGPRTYATTWVDGKGNFWFFGGTTVEGGNFVANDLWEYVP